MFFTNELFHSIFHWSSSITQQFHNQTLDILFNNCGPFFIVTGQGSAAAGRLMKSQIIEYLLVYSVFVKGKWCVSVLFMKMTNTDSIKRNHLQDGYRFFHRVIVLSLYSPSYRTSTFGYAQNGFVSNSIQNGKVWRMGFNYRLHRWNRNFLNYY